MNWKAQFTAWLKSKNWTAHSLAIIGLTAAGLITGDPQVRNFILEVFKAHPTLGADIVILAGIVAKYSHSSSAAGKVAVAEEILASANPPSLAAVAAATVKPPPNLSSKIPPAAILALLAVFLALPSLTACKGPTATAPLAPGYANQADETMGQTLAGARSFYTSIATAKDLTDAEKTALNNLGKAINVAEAAYTSFHAGQVTQAAAQTAVDQVTAKQNAVEALGVKP